MEAIRGAKTAGGEQPRMLHVSLAPAAIALGALDDGRRSFFVAAFDVMRQPHRPTCAPHQRRLYEIVRKNAPAERLAARQIRKRAMLHERLHPDDRVVAP